MNELSIITAWYCSSHDMCPEAARLMLLKPPCLDNLPDQGLVSLPLYSVNWTYCGTSYVFIICYSLACFAWCSAVYSCHYPSCCLHLNCNISLSHLSSCSIPCFSKFRRCLPGCEVLTKFSSCSDAENLIHSFPWNKRRHNGSACAPFHHTLAYRKFPFCAWQRCHSSLLIILQINQRDF